MTSTSHEKLFSPIEDVPTAASRLQELKLKLPAQLNYQLDKLFPKTTGWGWKRPMKARHKLLCRVESILTESLLDGEEILYISKGTRYSFVEFYFIGLWSMTINHTVFVLTNLRLIMMNCDSKGKPKKTLWMIYYSQIEKFKGTWNGMLNLKLKDGKKLSFTGFPRYDRKTMPAIIQDALDRYRETGFDPHVSQSLENLCYHCKQTIPKNHHDCDQCGASYWKPTQLAWRSFIFPSWGDFLMGHHTIAVIELIGGIFTWSGCIILVINGIRDSKPENFMAAFFLFIIAHGIDAMITMQVAKKGLNPRSGPTDVDTEVATA